MSFVEDCKKNGLDPSIVAQHTVFAGNTKITEVWKKGIESVFGGLIFDMKHPLFDESQLNRTVDKKKIKLLPEGSKNSLDAFPKPLKAVV